ncbi:sugar phosphate isomerase/epimerase [uncultured Roseovarius sp.]|uniref:sugar phosphate isomerase/epimerase family protein n=1 Tax=uncultured Roseovarius sp. TaxID=293344 RepID=UPI002601CE3B|nr:sugar phosphate isomerase/epimerase [uncultured Roseovarius sp.]
MMPPLSLAHLSFLDLPPPEFIQVAAEAGFASVGLRLIAVTETTPGYALMTDSQMMRDTLKALKATGITVNDIEFVTLTPGFDAGSLDPFLATGAELGAKYIITAPYDPDLRRMTENLDAFGARAASFGLSPVLEFFPWTNVPDFAAAMDIATATGDPSIGVLLDTLHFDRSGSDLRDVAKAGKSRLPFIHLCDADVRPTYSEAELLHTARAARLLPGEGGIALTEILALLPGDAGIALEIPQLAQPGRLPAEQRARRMYDVTQDYLNRAYEKLLN